MLTFRKYLLHHHGNREYVVMNLYNSCDLVHSKSSTTVFDADNKNCRNLDTIVRVCSMTESQKPFVVLYKGSPLILLASN